MREVLKIGKALFGDLAWKNARRRAATDLLFATSCEAQTGEPIVLDGC